jgi:hypothetical protein
MESGRGLKNPPGEEGRFAARDDGEYSKTAWHPIEDVIFFRNPISRE